jgi:hypothetical protein
MENAIAVVHEGWAKNRNRVQLKNKQYDLPNGFPDMYKINENM